MKKLYWLTVLAALVAGCDQPQRKAVPNPQAIPTQAPTAAPAPATLAEARKGFTTNLARRESANMPVPAPPPKIFRVVQFDSPAGKLSAYLSPDPKDGKKRPAIIWITGGDCNSIDQGCWQQGPPNNDQSASQYRQAGILMMFPTLRGGNDNPGVREGFLGEIDDVVAAYDYLVKEPYVDPARIYLGGHSTGGTVALLAAEYTDRFRAVFPFGPAENPTGYAPEYVPFRTNDVKEVDLRSPIKWLGSIKSPTFVFEGVTGNKASLEGMREASTNPKVQFFLVSPGSHFNILAPLNRRIAEKILADTGPECNIAFTADEVNGLMKR